MLDLCWICATDGDFLFSRACATTTAPLCFILGRQYSRVNPPKRLTSVPFFCSSCQRHVCFTGKPASSSHESVVAQTRADDYLRIEEAEKHSESTDLRQAAFSPHPATYTCSPVGCFMIKAPFNLWDDQRSTPQRNPEHHVMKHLFSWTIISNTPESHFI